MLINGVMGCIFVIISIKFNQIIKKIIGQTNYMDKIKICLVAVNLVLISTYLVSSLGDWLLLNNSGSSLSSSGYDLFININDLLGILKNISTALIIQMLIFDVIICKSLVIIQLEKIRIRRKRKNR